MQNIDILPLQSLVIRSNALPHCVDIMMSICPPATSENKTRKGLEYLNIPSLCSDQSRSLLDECAGSLRELYVSDCKMYPFPVIQPADSFSKLVHIRRIHLHCKVLMPLWAKVFTGLLATLPSPSPLTHLGMSLIPHSATKSPTEEISEISWHTLDDLLGSSRFPSLQEFNLSIRGISEEEFMWRAKEGRWLTKCFEQGIVRYGEVDDFDDMMHRSGFSWYPDRLVQSRTRWYP
ncbi:hypothetical protein K474DRAFT_78967 [Panus rudis PR-1116 ss-1]|nr:hypothetical protein K474DRAFT_78967 [Panus rudis PR-1116 ss-1]